MTDRYSVTYERALPVPIDDAYRWLTDYDDGDGRRAGAVIQERRVVSRTDRHVELDEEVAVLGRRRSVRTVVELNPPDQWAARIVEDGEPGDIYVYHLTPGRAPGHSTLTVEYRYATRNWLHRLLLGMMRPLILRKVRQMWDGYEDAMRRELDAANPKA